MLELNRIPFKELRNDEIILAINQGCGIVLSDDPHTSTVIETRRAAAAAYPSILSVLFAKDPASEKTAQIIAEDHRRDSLVTGIKSIAFGNTKLYIDLSVVNAGHLVFRAFQKHGDINVKSYNEETSIIKQIIQEVNDNVELKAATIKLNLGIWFTELNKSNNAFYDLYILRIKEQGGEPQDNPADKRREAIQAYQFLMDGIAAAANLDDTGSYNTLINNLNQLAAKYETTLAARKTNNAKTPNTPN